MRKIVAGAFVSLDGVMQAPGGPEEDPTGGFEHGGWTVPYWDEPMGQFMDACFSQPFDLLLGRKTYEIFAAHWPFVGEDDPIGRVFNEVTKYVVTSSSSPLTWKNSIALTGDVVAEVARLKQGTGPMLLTQGSSILLQALLAHDLIDELRLLTFPLVLGNGKKLFGLGTKARAETGREQRLDDGRHHERVRARRRREDRNLRAAANLRRRTGAPRQDKDTGLRATAPS